MSVVVRSFHHFDEAFLSISHILSPLFVRGNKSGCIDIVNHVIISRGSFGKGQGMDMSNLSGDASFFSAICSEKCGGLCCDPWWGIISYQIIKEGGVSNLNAFRDRGNKRDKRQGSEDSGWICNKGVASESSV